MQWIPSELANYFMKLQYGSSFTDRILTLSTAKRTQDLLQSGYYGTTPLYQKSFALHHQTVQLIGFD